MNCHNDQNGKLRDWVALALLLCFLGAGFGMPRSQAIAADLEVLTPRSGGTVYARNPETHIVIRQIWSQGVRMAKVRSADVTFEPTVVDQHQGQDYLHFRVPLQSGMNTFTIVPGGQKIEVRYQPLFGTLDPSSFRKDVYLFHRDEDLPSECANCHDLQKTGNRDLVGHSKQVSCITCHSNIVDVGSYQHSTTTNGQCLACHQTFVKPWRIGFPGAKTEEICLTCHASKKTWRSRKYIHGPLNVGGCTICHNPHGGDYRNQLWAEGSLDLCIACHGDKENLVDKKRGLPFVHGIIQGKGCVACHDPHATDNKFLVIEETNKLCVSCHTGLDGIKRGHPVGGHPVAGPNERRRPGRKLNCTSCHDPHGSRHSYMLIGESRGGHVCIHCHR